MDFVNLDKLQTTGMDELEIEKQRTEQSKLALYH